MKTKLIQRASNLVAILAFLAIFAGKAFAVDNDSRVVSPYWQSDSGSYTFIAVTHTSLSGMASQIGVRINAIQNDETTFGGSAVSFTIQSGSTQRVFITRSGHATINPTTIPTASFIQGTTDFKHGHFRIDPVATHPQFSVTGNKYGKFSRCTDVSNCQSSLNNVRNGGGYRAVIGKVSLPSDQSRDEIVLGTLVFSSVTRFGCKTKVAHQRSQYSGR